jgi:hypothetical protein
MTMNIEVKYERDPITRKFPTKSELLLNVMDSFDRDYENLVKAEFEAFIKRCHKPRSK